ncbi:hypothetical protein GCM10023094_50170 [Rhodococcus olei]|uniref:Serine/threonine protein kinase n=1 Tax=Rhodococcus olei TaxID=2161675 RepID=A0ABP8PKD4_9NOCA
MRTESEPTTAKSPETKPPRAAAPRPRPGPATPLRPMPVPPVARVESGPPAPGAETAPPGWEMMPGSVFAAGRYRLLERCGGSAETEFWRAHDTTLARDVALTVADLRGGDTSKGIADFFARTGRLSRVRSEALTPILDMIEVDGRAVVVAQWQASRPLDRTRAARPSDAAVSVTALARMVRDAHRDGGVVAVDEPGRVRVTDGGITYLAFPGVPAHATARQDVRGLGAVLSELLAGMHHTGPGRPLPPSAARPDLPAALSGVVVRAAGPAEVTAAEVVAALEAVTSPVIGPEFPSDATTPEAVDAAVPVAAESADPAPWPTWVWVALGTTLLVVLATIGWFVGVALLS